MNVLSDAMKFGKLLNRVRGDGKVYLNYKELKQCTDDLSLFREKLKREVNYVDTYYKREEVEVMKDRNDRTIAGLRRYVTINVFAVVKVLHHHSKSLDENQQITTLKEVAETLAQTAFYNAMRTSSVFTMPVTSCQRPAYCEICRMETFHACELSSCNHTFCWSCIQNTLSASDIIGNCPSCGEAAVLSPTTILSEDILGVEPRVVPSRRMKRGRHKSNTEKDSIPVEGSPTATPTQASDDTPASKTNRYYCSDCSMILNSFRQAQIHMNGQRHLDQVQRIKDQCVKEGTVYEDTNRLVDYNQDTKVSRFSKPRRSRGGVKNKQKAAGRQLDPPDAINIPVQPSFEIPEGDVEFQWIPSFRNNELSCDVRQFPQAVENRGGFYANFWGSGELGLPQLAGPYLSNFPYLEKSTDSVPTQSEPNSPQHRQPSPITPQVPQLHAFQDDVPVNTSLRGYIDKVISTRCPKALSALREILTNDKNGSKALVDEIFRGIFNGESTLSHSNFCKVLLDSEDLEVSLSTHEVIHHLLQKCRETAATPITTTKIEYEMPQEQIDSIEESELRAKFRRGTAIKFSTDLYVKDILPEALVHICIQTMLFGRTTGKIISKSPEHEIDENDVATVCRILEMVGEKMRLTSPSMLSRYDINLFKNN